MPRKEKTTYVLCVRDQREYELLRREAIKKYGEDAIVAQAIEVGRLVDDVELVCGFFVGNGNVKDAHGKQIEREFVLTEPVAVSNHWTSGSKGRLGKLRLADFLTEANAQTASRNANIRHYNDELTIGYG